MQERTLIQVGEGNGSCSSNCDQQLVSCIRECETKHWKYDVIGLYYCKDWCRENIYKPCSAKC